MVIFISEEVKSLAELEGASDKMSEGSVNQDELKMGIEIELEHTKDRNVAKKIALDHLAEIADYYTRLKKMEADAGKSFIVYTDSMEFKAEGEGLDKNYFACGYLMTPDLDLVNDAITPECHRRIEQRILGREVNVVKVGIEHTEIRAGDTRVIPAAKVIEVRYDGKGLFAKTKLNKHHPEFNTIWGSIEGGFLDAFSIEFKPLQWRTEMRGNKQVRLLDDVFIGGVTFTGRPINPACKITDFFVKARDAASTMDQILHSEGVPTQAPLQKPVEVKNMSEDTKPTGLEQKSPESAGLEIKNDSKDKGDEKSIAQGMLEIKAQLAELKAENAEMKKLLEVKAMIKDAVKDIAPETKAFETVDPATETKLKALPAKFEGTAELPLDTKSMIEATFGKPRF